MASSKIVRMIDMKDDNRLWSPAECLKEVLSEIESGRLKVEGLVVLYTARCQEHPEDKEDLHMASIRANLSHYEELWLLENQKLFLLEAE